MIKLQMLMPIVVLTLIKVMVCMKASFPLQNYVGMNQTFTLTDVEPNLTICGPEKALFSKYGNNCMYVDNRITIKQCSNSILVFELSNLNTTDSGYYYSCPYDSTSWNQHLQVQDYHITVEAINSTALTSSNVQDGDTVILRCNLDVPSQSRYFVKWTRSNEMTDVFYQFYSLSQDDYLTLDVSNTVDCDMFSCEILDEDDRILGKSSGDPFKINKVKASQTSLYTGSAISFMLNLDLFSQNNQYTFHHSSGGLMYEITRNQRTGTLDITYSRNTWHPLRTMYFLSGNTIVITLEDLVQFDSGMYKLKSGNNVLWSESISVIGFPAVIIFSTDQPVLGKQLILSCSVTGYYPFQNYIWYHTVEGIREEIPNENQRELNISKLTTEHRNRIYECKQQAFQSVRSPPYQVNLFVPTHVRSFTINGVSNDVTVNNGDVVDISCQHESSLTVKKTISHQSTIINDQSDATWTATCEHDGVWECLVFDDYGLKDTATIKLTVENCPPMLLYPQPDIDIEVTYGGSNNTMIPFTGTRPGFGGPSPTLSRSLGPLNLTIDEMAKQVKIQVEKVNENHVNMTYSFELTNQLGVDSKNIVINIKGAPQPPSDLTALSISGSEAVLQWTKGFMGGANQSFDIEFKTPNSNWTIVDKIPPADNLEQIYAHMAVFETDTSYNYRVRGFNDEGASPYSNILTVTYFSNTTKVTNVGAPPPPSDLTALSISSSEAVLQWKNGFMRGGNQSFDIEFKTPDSNWTIVDKVPPADSVEQIYAHTAVFETYINYNYRVRGFNDEGASPYSNILTVTYFSNTTVEEPPPGDNTMVIVVSTTVALLAFFIFLVLLCVTWYRSKHVHSPDKTPIIEDLQRVGRRPHSYPEPTSQEDIIVPQNGSQTTSSDESSRYNRVLSGSDASQTRLKTPHTPSRQSMRRSGHVDDTDEQGGHIHDPSNATADELSQNINEGARGRTASTEVQYGSRSESQHSSGGIFNDRLEEGNVKNHGRSQSIPPAAQTNVDGSRRSMLEDPRERQVHFNGNVEQIGINGTELEVPIPPPPPPTAIAQSVRPRHVPQY